MRQLRFLTPALDSELDSVTLVGNQTLGLGDRQNLRITGEPAKLTQAPASEIVRPFKY